MPISDGKIRSRDLCASVVTERVLADDSVYAGAIQDGAITYPNFASTIRPVQIVSVLPSSGMVEGDFAYLTTDKKLYRYSGTAWILSVDGADITSRTIPADRIIANSITAGEIQAAAISTSELNVSLSLVVGQTIGSTTYTPGSAGWQIAADGTAEFNNVTVRGTIDAGAGSDVDWSYISNVSIDNADITSLSFSKITAATNTASLTIGSAGLIKSANFVTGSAGWQIEADGTAEFQNATIRGSLNASDLDAGTLAAARIATNSLSVGVISGGTYGNADITFSSGSDLKSSNFVAATSGWQISGNGNAEFNNVTVRGTIYASAGTIGGLTVDDTITLTSGGIFRTAASGTRWQLSSSAVNSIYGYTGVSGEQFPGYIYVVGTGTTNPITELALYAPAVHTSGNKPPSIRIHSEKTGASTYDSYIGFENVERIYLGGGTVWNTTALVYFSDGSAGTPSISFASDTNSGVYSYSGDKVGISAGGSMRAVFDSDGITVVAGKFNAGAVGTNDYLQLRETENDFRVVLDAGVTFESNTGKRSGLFTPTGMSVGNASNASIGWAFDGDVAYGHIARNATGTNLIVQKVSSPGFNSTFVSFYYNSTLAGSIYATSASVTVYGTSSDYRLKKNPRPIPDALYRLRSLKPIMYEWKADDVTGAGYFAHEAAELIPWGVNGTKDNPDEYQSMDNAKLIPFLHAAIIELDARVRALESV